jgi:hypothetical protein
MVEIFRSVSDTNLQFRYFISMRMILVILGITAIICKIQPDCASCYHIINSAHEMKMAFFGV